MFPIIALTVAFLLLLGPAYSQIWNAIRSLFVSILCKELITKSSISKAEYDLLVRHMQHKPFGLLRKLIVKKNLSTIVEKFNKASRKELENAIHTNAPVPYRRNYKAYGANNTSKFAVALRNIVLAAPESFDKIQNLVIDKARDFNNPDLIYAFAIACEDMPISYRVLYMAITNYKSSDARRSFEDRYKNKPEIERLITISP